MKSEFTNLFLLYSVCLTPNKQLLRPKLTMSQIILSHDKHVHCQFRLNIVLYRISSKSQ